MQQSSKDESELAWEELAWEEENKLHEDETEHGGDLKLLTKQVVKDLSVKTAEEVDPMVKAHWFNPYGRGHWFGIEMIDEENEIVFGYVSLFGDWNDELGDFSLKELAEVNCNPFNKNGQHMGIERDRYFSPMKLSEVKNQYTKY